MDRDRLKRRLDEAIERGEITEDEARAEMKANEDTELDAFYDEEN